VAISAGGESRGQHPPNLLILITDQQLSPRHWADAGGWLAELMPNDAELERS
jgi:hypothetical protein